MALPPDRLCEEFKKNVAQLRADGYRTALQDELPADFRHRLSGDSYLINDQNRIVGVNAGLGNVYEIQAASPAP
jgi:hypothetical protein